MLRCGLIFAVVGFAALAPGRATAAPEAPWCAVVQVGRESLVEDCRYRTFEECWPNVISGNRGFCNQNPRYRAPAPAPRRAKRPADPS